VHDSLTVGANDAISVVEEELVDDALVTHSQLGAHDVLLHLPAEILQSPAGVELDFKFDLLGAWALGINIRGLVGRVALLEMTILDLDRHKQLDPLMMLQLVAGHERRLLSRRVHLARWLLRRRRGLHLLRWLLLGVACGLRGTRHCVVRSLLLGAARLQI